MKNVLITGASRGLGLAIARQVAQNGFRVIAASRTRSPEMDALIAERSATTVDWLPLDLEKVGQLHEFVVAATRRFGPLYGLVNNAAIGLAGVLATQHEQDIDRLITTNLTASIVLTKYAVRSMLPQRQGRVVHISSIAAFSGFNGLSVYAATKAGLLGFNRALAREVGPAGIAVNCIAPGFLKTEMTSGLEGDRLAAIQRRTPRGELASVDEVAAAVVFLLSPGASGITGSTLTVDAGSSA